MTLVVCDNKSRDPKNTKNSVVFILDSVKISYDTLRDSGGYEMIKVMNTVLSFKSLAE